MTVPYNGDTTTIDYTYDDNGQVVAVSITAAHDHDDDGRDDYVQTADYTIDPSITVTDPSEIDDISSGSEPFSVLAVQAADSGLFYIDVRTTLGDLPGAVTRTESHWYSYEGGAMRSSVADDMITEQHAITTYSYDASGRVTEMDSTNETSHALYTSRITFTYNAHGRMARLKLVSQSDRYNDGWIDAQSINEITYTYDASGNKVSKIEDRYNDSYLRTTTYTYDASGMLTGEDYKMVRRGSESVEDHETIARSYDTAGRLAQKVLTEYSINADGIETPSVIDTIAFIYDDGDRVVQKVRDNDGDADPLTQNTIYTDTYAYGGHGLATYEYTCEYASGGGYSYTYDMAYNAQGQLTEKRHTYDSDNDDVADSFRSETYTYDDNGRLLSRSYAYHEVVDGGPTAASDKYIYAFSYDTEGRLVGFSYEEYDNGTDINEQMAAVITYDESGSGASGTMETFSLDEIIGNLISDGPAKAISYTFAAEIPTGAVAASIQSFPYNGSEMEPFEEQRLTIDMPVLFSLYFFNSTMFMDPS